MDWTFCEEMNDRFLVGVRWAQIRPRHTPDSIDLDVTGGAQIGFRVCLKLRDLHFEVGGMPDIIIIEKGKYLAARLLHSPVASCGGTARLSDLDHTDRWPSGTEPRGGMVHRAIVDDYDLEVGKTLCLDAGKRARQ
jgi:hypothetical protein